MAGKIYLCTSMENVELLDRAMQNYADLFRGMNSAPIEFSTDRPVFETKESGAHLNGNSSYQIYIGKEIEKRTEYPGGLELPLRVLADESSFRELVNAFSYHIARLEREKQNCVS